MALFILASKRMAVVRVQARLPTWMAALMTANGETIRNKAWASFNTSIELNMSESGTEMFAKVMEPTSLPMETSTKVTGIETCKTVEEHTTTQTEISIKATGSMVGSMEMVTTFMQLTRGSSKEPGKMVKRKVLGSWLLMTNMATLGPGIRTRNKGEVLISTRMVRDTKESG